MGSMPDWLGSELTPRPDRVGTGAGSRCAPAVRETVTVIDLRQIKHFDLPDPQVASWARSGSLHPPSDLLGY